MKTGKSPTDGFYRSAASAPEIPLSSATINTQLFTGIFQPTPPIFLSFFLDEFLASYFIYYLDDYFSILGIFLGIFLG